jgi:hypothetical protein
MWAAAASDHVPLLTRLGMNVRRSGRTAARERAGVHASYRRAAGGHDRGHAGRVVEPCAWHARAQRVCGQRAGAGGERGRKYAQYLFQASLEVRCAGGFLARPAPIRRDRRQSGDTSKVLCELFTSAERHVIIAGCAFWGASTIFAKQLADKLTWRDAVAWYDPRREFTPFFDELRGSPRSGPVLVPIKVAGVAA